jgi:hypothetical protein
VTGFGISISGPASLGSNQLGRNLLRGELGFGKPSLLVGPGDPSEAREEQVHVAISATSWVYVRGKSWHLLTRSIVRHCRSAAELLGSPNIESAKAKPVVLNPSRKHRTPDWETEVLLKEYHYYQESISHAGLH